MNPPMLTIDHDDGIVLVWCYGASPGWCPVDKIYKPPFEKQQEQKDTPQISLTEKQTSSKIGVSEIGEMYGQ